MDGLKTKRIGRIIKPVCKSDLFCKFSQIQSIELLTKWLLSIFPNNHLNWGKSYSISTAINGTGEIEGSYCTPTGKFKIAEKIGSNLELGSVLVEREPTGEIYNPDLAKKNPDRIGYSLEYFG